MTKKKTAPKKAAKKGKVKRTQPPDNKMAVGFDAAMDRIAKAPWPPPK